ncbi:MAG: polyamine aminopropyltransferase [Bacteroidota bacterium]
MTRTHIALLLCSVFIIAVCGILYELLISTLTSYFQGSSILHFSLVIGFFLSFMGVGSYLSKYIQKDLLKWFISLEIVLGVLGGMATLILYSAFSFTEYYYVVAFGLIGLLGSIIGMEIPLLTRIVREHESLKDALALVLSFDYIGALIASILFPLVFLPFLGTMKTAFLIGILNIIVAIMNTWTFRSRLKEYKQLMVSCFISILVLGGSLAYSFKLVSFFEQFLYRNEVVYTHQSQYQRIVLTKFNDDLRLFLDGNLQFASRDEYRYHESLVHIPYAWASTPKNILILGGGDGLVTRELKDYPNIEKITLVDIDPKITELAKEHPLLVSINEGAMSMPIVHTVHQDAFKFVEESTETYDLIIADLPDPHDSSIGRMYTREFYQLVYQKLNAGGVYITQASSPYFSPTAFWCIKHTLDTAFPVAVSMQVDVPSFGPWGFHMAKKLSPRMPGADSVSVDTYELAEKLSLSIFSDSTSYQYLREDMLPALFVFDGDMEELETDVNRLDDQVLLNYYAESWKYWQ